ncbi:MAG: hypothetical protein AABX98_00935 [Nanoarchaeota archaeon]
MERILNHKQIRMLIAKQKVKVGSNALPMLEEKVLLILEQAINRAKQNARKTLLSRDL